MEGLHEARKQLWISGQRSSDRGESPGLSAFALQDGVVYHTYSACRRLHFSRSWSRLLASSLRDDPGTDVLTS